jgi:Fe-S-cluster containining protein
MAEIDYSETESVTFVCEKCGECCRHIESFVEILPHQRNGICNFLQGDICSIYENRPDLCDFKRAYKYFKEHWAEKEYCKRVTYFCKQLKELKLERIKNDEK